MAFLISYAASRVWLYLRRQRGQTMVEYALVLVMVAIVAVIILVTQGATVSHVFSNVICGMSHIGGCSDSGRDHHGQHGHHD